MPVVEAPLVEYLGGVLGGLVGDRIVPMRGEEGIALPYVVYQRISATRANDYDPPGTMRAWVEARYQFTVWDRTILGAIIVGEELAEALNGFHGDMEGLYVSSRIVFELDGWAEDIRLYRRIVDAIIGYEEGGSGS